MFSFAHLFYGIVMVGLGVLGLKYNFRIVNFTGRQDWIESKLGGGSTFLAYKLFSLLVIAAGLLLATGLLDPVLTTLLGPLKNIFGGGQ